MSSISDALLLYIGFGMGSFPKENPAALIATFGREQGLDLTERAQALLRELDSFKADWSKDTLASASHSAAMQIAARHPELDDRAVAALEWIYSWWWK